MKYISHYQSPLGNILLAADEQGLTGLWFEGQKYYAQGLDPNCKERENLLFTKVKHWLDVYFSGQEPTITIPLHFIGTDFQKEVWEILCSIPYGSYITYKQIANHFAAKRGLKYMSAQSIGGAVGHNKISIIVPCHRIVGTNGSLTGYAGGLDKKYALLSLENANLNPLFIPKKVITL